jgi:membrane-associated phospholipid phosphatase
MNCAIRRLSAPHLLMAVFLLTAVPSFGQDSPAGAPKTPEDTSQTVQPDQKPEEVIRSEETKDPPTLGKKFFTNVLADQRDMWTSPFHMNQDDRKWWLLFTGMTGVLIATDHRTIREFNPSQVSISRDISQIGAGYTTIPVAVGLYFYGAARDNAKARESGVLGAEALVNAAAITYVLKTVSGRERPPQGEGKGSFFKGHNSFPSGHAAMSWAFASLIAHEYRGRKIVPIAVYGFSTIVSASRFTARKHFASDILAGGAIGWFVGRHVFQKHFDPSIHKRTNPALSFMSHIVPKYDPWTGARGVTLTWSSY